MKSVVRPELPTAAAGSSQALTAAVDNSAPRSTHPESTYKSGKAVQRTGTTSNGQNRNERNLVNRRHRFFYSAFPVEQPTCTRDRRLSDSEPP